MCNRQEGKRNIDCCGKIIKGLINRCDGCTSLSGGDYLQWFYLFPCRGLIYLPYGVFKISVVDPLEECIQIAE